jgi:NADP-dependent 3-hydroxy acid dehydrogenase YdfG
MAGSLAGRKIAITGGSSGIGAATAELLASEGAEVVIGARREDRLAELVERIEAAGGTAYAQRVDVADEESAREFVTGAAKHMGGLDGLINNAGVMLLGPIDGADTDDWRRMVEVNMLGLLYCTHAALPILREGGGGDIVNISSVAGRIASAGSGVYNLTKWGVGAFSEALRQETGWAKIRVTIVEPGFVDTELQGHNKIPYVQETIKKMYDEIGKVLDADDIARAILYAVSQPEHVSVNEILVRPTGQPR